jgi:hypothetical protein
LKKYQTNNLLFLLDGFDCDFENNFCGWTQDPKAELDWLRIKGKTATPGTGPNFDQ